MKRSHLSLPISHQAAQAKELLTRKWRRKLYYAHAIDSPLIYDHGVRIVPLFRFTASTTPQTTATIRGLKDNISALNKELESTDRTTEAGRKRFEQLQEQQKANIAELTAFRRELRQSATLSTRVAQGMVRAFTQIGTAIAAAFSVQAVFRGIGQLVQLSRDIEEGFARANTVIQETPENLQRISQAALEIGAQGGASLREIPSALFDIASAGIPAGQQLESLEAAVRASEAGFLDLATTVNSGVKILQAAGDQLEDLEGAYDVIFTTQKLGITTVQELAQAFPQLLPQANALELSINDVALALANYTRQGIRTDEATTLLRNSLTALANPDITRRLQETLGVEVFDADGRIRPLVALFGDLRDTIGELTPEARAAALAASGITNVRARNGINALIEGYEDLVAISGEFADVQGELQRQFDASDSSARRLAQAQNELQVALLGNAEGLSAITELQIALVQGATDVVEAANQIIEVFRESEGLATAFTVALRILAGVMLSRFLAAVTPTRIGLLRFLVTMRQARASAGGFSGVLRAAGAGFTAFGRTITASLGGPIGVLITLGTVIIPELVSEFDRLFGKSEELKEAQDDLTAAQERGARVAETLATAQREISTRVEEEEINVEKLFNTLRDTNAARGEQQAAIDQLIQRYPQLRDVLIDEEGNLRDVESAYLAVRDAIQEKITAQVQEAAARTLIEEQNALLVEQREFLEANADALGVTQQQIDDAIEGLRVGDEELQNRIQSASDAGDNEAVERLRDQVIAVDNVREAVEEFRRTNREAAEDVGFLQGATTGNIISVTQAISVEAGNVQRRNAFRELSTEAQTYIENAETAAALTRDVGQALDDAAESASRLFGQDDGGDGSGRTFTDPSDRDEQNLVDPVDAGDVEAAIARIEQLRDARIRAAQENFALSQQTIADEIALLDARQAAQEQFQIDLQDAFDNLQVSGGDFQDEFVTQSRIAIAEIGRARDEIESDDNERRVRELEAQRQAALDSIDAEEERLGTLVDAQEDFQIARANEAQEGEERITEIQRNAEFARLEIARQAAVARLAIAVDEDEIAQLEADIQRIEASISRLTSDTGTDSESILSDFFDIDEQDAQAAVQELLNGINQLPGIIGQFADAQAQEALNAVDRVIEEAQLGVQALQEEINAIDELGDEASIAERERQAIRRQELEENLATQQAQLQALEAERLELERQQFERSKKNQRASAIVAGALAAVQAFAQLGPIAGAVAAAFIAASTAAQIAIINAQQFSAFKDGGKIEDGLIDSYEKGGQPAPVKAIRGSVTRRFTDSVVKMQSRDPRSVVRVSGGENVVKNGGTIKRGPTHESGMLGVTSDGKPLLFSGKEFIMPEEATEMFEQELEMMRQIGLMKRRGILYSAPKQIPLYRDGGLVSGDAVGRSNEAREGRSTDTDDRMIELLEVIADKELVIAAGRVADSITAQQEAEAATSGF